MGFALTASTLTRAFEGDTRTKMPGISLLQVIGPSLNRFVITEFVQDLLADEVTPGKHLINCLLFGDKSQRPRQTHNRDRPHCVSKKTRLPTDQDQEAFPMLLEPFLIKVGFERVNLLSCLPNRILSPMGSHWATRFHHRDLLRSR